MAVFEPVEVTLLRGLVGQLVELVDDGLPQGEVEEADWAVELGLADVGVSGPTMPPEDPVLRRLFPDAYAEGVGDPDSSSEFRRFTENGLRRTKSSRARTVLSCLAEPPPEPDEDPVTDDGDPVTVRLDPQQTQAWLTVLTDLRLALAIRLGIETEDDAAELDALAQAELARLRRARRRLRGARPADSDGDPRVGVYQVYSWLGLLQESLVGTLE
jgi:hypothetical protein